MESDAKNPQKVLARLSGNNSETSENKSMRKQHEEDSQIVGLLLQKDAHGLEKLMQKYHVRLFSKAIGISPNPLNLHVLLAIGHWRSKT